MAARNRPRVPLKEEPDAHEERDLWAKIVKELQELRRMSERVQELMNEIQREEEGQAEAG